MRREGKENEKNRKRQKKDEKNRDREKNDVHISDDHCSYHHISKINNTNKRRKGKQYIYCEVAEKALVGRQNLTDTQQIILKEPVRFGDESQ